MHKQPNPTRLVPTAAGVLVLDGYGVRLHVEHGRLHVTDGIGTHRRSGQFPRAGSGLRGSIVIGVTGSISLPSLRWLADVGVGLVQLDTDGRVLIASAGLGRNDPRLRRAQATAIDTPTGDDIARRLISEKVAAQADTLRGVDVVAPVGDDVIEALRDVPRRLHVATSRDEIRTAEALAAAAYWRAWADVPVRFARRDAGRVPEAWLRFGTRSSPLTASPRLAVAPAQAILNYLYSLLEAEARLACLTVGLDPGLGVLHADLNARDSLALDVMEPIRPVVDRWVLAMLERRSFRAADFTRPGRACAACLRRCHTSWPRLRSTGARSWARWPSTSPRCWARVRAPRSRHRSADAAAQLGEARPSRPRTPKPARPRRSCPYCGDALALGRRTCERCTDLVVADASKRVVEGRAGSARRAPRSGRASGSHA